MVWALVVLAAASAVVHLLLVVPRLPPPAPDGDEPLPDYPGLASVPGALAVGGAAVVCGLLVLPAVPATHAVMWLGHLGAGAALAWVDLRTTWLPRRLHQICLAQVLGGLAVVAVADWRVAVAGAVGGVAAFGLFHLVWALGGGFGYGDVRLAGTIGVLAGTQGATQWFTAVLAATLVGALWAVIHALARRGQATAPFPYGPSLWLGPVVAVVATRLGG